MGAGPATRQRPQLDYHPELDGIRAFAVLAVMLYHGLPIAHGRFHNSGFMYQGGFLGVDVFFVLSGYLITTLLLREWNIRDKIKLGYFYARRALRLLPALFLTIVLGAVVVKTIQQPFPNVRPYRQSALLAITYVANWFQITKELKPLGHVWSLSIEEQYYIVWPTLLILGIKLIRSKRVMAYLVFAAAGIMSLARYEVFSWAIAHKSFHAFAFASLSTFTRPDGVLIGSGLALLLADVPEWMRKLFVRRDLALLACAVVGVGTIVLSIESPHLYQGGLTIVNLCTAAVVGHLVLNQGSFLRRMLAARPLPQIGRISYGLYLYHIPVLYLVIGNPAPHKTFVDTARFLVITFVVATVSYVVVERPILKLKSRFGSLSRMPAADPAATSADAAVDTPAGG